MHYSMHVNIKCYRCLLSVRSQYHANNMQNKYKYTKKLLKKYMHTTSKRITCCKQNTHALQRKLQHAANERITCCKQTSRTLQRKLQHAANKSKSTARAGWRKGLVGDEYWTKLWLDELVNCHWWKLYTAANLSRLQLIKFGRSCVIFAWLKG